MNLSKKKSLAARTLGIGKERIVFNNLRLDEIKDIITKQDVRDLVVSGAIHIKGIQGRKTKVKRNNRRRGGSRRKIVINKKQVYVRRTRKLRAYLKSLKSKKQITQDIFFKLRQEIKASAFKDLNHLRERISQLKEK